jgi:hypothetical protein
MPHPLDGARLKVVRAKKHLTTLKREITRYLNSKPYDFNVDRKGQTITVTRAIINVEPPSALSCILGDCVGNLRAALDYIAWQLAVKHHPSLAVGVQRDVSFPICDTANAFKDNRAVKALKTKYGISAAAISEIESVQPYSTGDHNLATLSTLVNQDKHCLPLFTLATAQTGELRAKFGGTTAIYIGGGRGALTATFDASHPLFSAANPDDVKVDADVAVFVTLQNVAVPREPIGTAVENLVKCVAHIVPRFDRFV